MRDAKDLITGGGLPQLTKFQIAVLQIGYYLSTVISVGLSYTGGFKAFGSHTIALIWAMFALMGCALPAAAYYYYKNKEGVKAVLFGLMSFVSLFFSVSGSYLNMQLDAQTIQLQAGAGDAYVADRRDRLASLSDEAAGLAANIAALNPLINDRNGAGNNRKTQAQIDAARARIAEIDGIKAGLQAEIDERVPPATIGAVFNGVGGSFGFNGAALFHLYTMANALAIDILLLVLSLFSAAAGVFIMKTVDGRVFVDDGDLRKSFLFDPKGFFETVVAGQTGGADIGQPVLTGATGTPPLATAQANSAGSSARRIGFNSTFDVSDKPIEPMIAQSSPVSGIQLPDNGIRIPDNTIRQAYIESLFSEKIGGKRRRGDALNGRARIAQHLGIDEKLAREIHADLKRRGLIRVDGAESFALVTVDEMIEKAAI
jgi:hypothetical protein